jgi:hypothetical protein
VICALPCRAWRWRAGAAAVGALLVSGCAAPVRVQTLATGQPDVPAYELHGPSMHALRAQVMALCPQGADVLRAAEQGKPMPPAGAGRLEQWTSLADRALDPQPVRAQLMVRCRPAPELMVVKFDQAAADAQAGLALASHQPGWARRLKAAVGVAMGWPAADAPLSGYDQ